MLNLIPYPHSVKQSPGHLIISRAPDITADEKLHSVHAPLVELFRPLPASTDDAIQIQLSLDPKIPSPEGYRLQMTPKKISITASAPAGAFYATMTLRQLIELSPRKNRAISLPLLTINDHPNFPWRGFMLDVSRHFFTADEVCQILDVIALYKFNRFHWHLTDDQGWRFPVSKYPLLTKIGGTRPESLLGHESNRPRQYDHKRHTGFYTSADIKRVVSHAANLHITVVPEIDMPGHMQAAIAAYPYLGNFNWPIEVRQHWGISTHILNPFPRTINFMKDVLAELTELFPGPYVHIGGDEAVKQQWSESKLVQKRMAELKLTGEDQLQSWCIKQMAHFLATRKKRLIGWDEITQGGTPSNAIVMGWRGTTHAINAATSGHDVIMAANTHTYFDYYQSNPKTEPLAIGGLLTLQAAYNFNPIPPELPEKYHSRILGGQCQLWSEYISTFDKLTYMAFPRACATAETLWLNKSKKTWPHFLARIKTHKKFLLTHLPKIGPIPKR